MGPIVAEIFEGPHYGAIFGTITVALIGGGAAGPWMAGIVHDATGSYQLGVSPGHRVLRRFRGGDLDSGAPQGAPCARPGAAGVGSGREGPVRAGTSNLIARIGVSRAGRPPKCQGKMDTREGKMSLAMEQVKTTTERDPRWRSVVNRDAAADGMFVYAVKSTGVYCRPSCPSRTAKPKNVTFYAHLRGCGSRRLPGLPALQSQGAVIVRGRCRGGRGSLPADRGRRGTAEARCTRRLRRA